MTTYRGFLEKHNGLIGLIIGIIGIGLSIYFFYKSTYNRDISYSVGDASLIFDSKSSPSAISVLDKNGKVVDGDIYLTKIKIWNSGSLPISKIDVRKPIKILISPEAQLLDFGISQETRPEIAKFSVKELPGNLNNKSLQLDWNYFDPGFGVEVQILYVRPSDTSVGFALDGYVLGVKSFNNATTYTIMKKSDPVRIYLLALMTLTFSIVLIYVFYLMLKSVINSFSIIKAIGLAFIFLFFLSSITVGKEIMQGLIFLQIKGPPF